MVSYERSAGITNSILCKSTGSKSAEQQTLIGTYGMRILKKTAFSVAILLNCEEMNKIN